MELIDLVAVSIPLDKWESNNQAKMADYGNYTTYHFDDVDEMSDYESTGAPPPPPPEDEYGFSIKRPVHEVSKDLENAGDVVDSEYDALNHTMATSPDYDDEAAEDGSVEIPPTKVVEDMMRREQEAETDKGGNKVVFLSVTVCVLLSLIIILSAGFGTGTFGGTSRDTQAQADSITGEPDDYQPNVIQGDGPAETQEAGGFEQVERPGKTPPDDIDGDTVGREESVGETGTVGGEDGVYGNAGVVDNGPSDGTSRGQDMRAYLSSASLAGPETFADLSSPESLALQWLVLEDPLKLDAAKAEDQFQITQRYALVSLWYNSDFTWANETNWLQGEECDWYGISCISLVAPSEAASDVSRSGGGMQVVTRINLEGNNVQGNIPPDLALLTFVTSLNLADNVIEGTIPASLVQMNSLEELLLDRNLLVGDISGYNFGPLSGGLQLLDLSSNGFTGNLPPSLWELTTLEFLVLDNNDFAGPLSAKIGNLTQLTRLTAGRNQLSSTIPAAVGTLPNLKVLWLFKNNFSGPLHGDWGSDLLVLDVYDNDMTGTIPSSIASLSKLQQLVLGGNKFNGAIPDVIGMSMPQLTVFNVEACQLGGSPIPASFSKLKNLTVLRIGNNPNMESVELPSFVFEDMRLLEELRLPGLSMTSNLDDQEWQNLRRLRVIDLSNNNFTIFPQEISGLQNLEELNLSENPNLTGNFPDDMDNLVRLKTLLVANSGLFGNLTSSIGNLARLEYLDISNNRLLGELPELGRMTNVQELKFGTNFFSGKIPESVGQLQKLQVLDLSVNFLGGEIPFSLSKVATLVILKLGENANEKPFSGFSGELPSLANLRNLARLELYSNRFTGPLPSEWGNMDKLQLLDVEFNEITGTIPKEWAGMTSLQELYVSNTDIQGTVPEEVCVSTLQFFVVDCDITCPCCSRCEAEDKAGRIR